MANGRAKLGAARRKLIKRQKTANVVSGVTDTLSTALAFAGTQMQGADTAWSEYEAGYKELGGTDPISRPKFGQKGWFKSAFKGPEGEIAIGSKRYDMANIRKAGAFLGSDAASTLSEKVRGEYLGRTAPGKEFRTEFGEGSFTIDSQLGEYSSKYGKPSSKYTPILSKETSLRKASEKTKDSLVDSTWGQNIKESGESISSLIGRMDAPMEKFNRASRNLQADIYEDEYRKENVDSSGPSIGGQAVSTGPQYDQEFIQQSEGMIAAWERDQQRQKFTASNQAISDALKAKLEAQRGTMNEYKNNAYDTWNNQGDFFDRKVGKNRSDMEGY